MLVSMLYDDFKLEDLLDYEIENCKRRYEDFKLSLNSDSRIFCVGDLHLARVYYNYFCKFCDVTDLYVFKVGYNYFFCHSEKQFSYVKKMLLRKEVDLVKSLSDVRAALSFIDSRFDGGSYE